MDITISLIERYIELNGENAHIKVSTEGPQFYLVFVKGKYEDNGNTTVILSPNELIEILELNGIIDKLRSNLNAQTNDRKDREKIREMLIYGTLAKYLIQMLNATLGKIYYPELTPLPRHSDYFRNIN